MQTAHCVSILNSPRVDAASAVINNHSGQLVALVHLTGNGATSFAKDLEEQGRNWLASSPEVIHQQILDLLSFCRQHQLQAQLSLCAKIDAQLVLATYAGAIWLQRQEQGKLLLTGQAEIKLIVGHYQADDLLILQVQASERLSAAVQALLPTNISLEKLVSELSVLKQSQTDLSDSLVLLNYQAVEPSGGTAEPINKPSKFNLAQLQSSWLQVSSKLKLAPQKIISTAKKIYTAAQKIGRRKLLVGGGSLLALIAAIILIQRISTYQQQQRLQSTQEELAPIVAEIEQIHALSASKPIAAKELAQQLLDQLQGLSTKHPDKKSQELIAAHLDQITALSSQIAAANALDQLHIAHNLGDFIGSKIHSNAQGIFVLESSGLAILWLDQQQNQQQITLPEGETINNFSVSDDQLFIHSASGLHRFNLNDRSWQQLKSSGESDREATLMASFGPYIYLLNPDKRNIYRYYYQNNQLSDPIGWLIDKQGLNFSLQNDLAVDGDLWLADQAGQLYKYSRGNRVDLTLQGLRENTSGPLLLAATADHPYLAALEKSKKRLLLLTKEGQLYREITSNELAGVTSISFDTESQLLALSGSIIYRVEF